MTDQSSYVNHTEANTIEMRYRKTRFMQSPCTVIIGVASLTEILCILSTLRIEQSTTGDAAADVDGNVYPTGELNRTHKHYTILYQMDMDCRQN